MKITPTSAFAEMDDETLMANVAAKEPNALWVIHKRYHSILKSIIISVIHDETEADDVLQEVFIQIWTNASNYSVEKGKAAGWLITLARRRAIDRLRQRHAYQLATERLEKASKPSNAYEVESAHHDIENHDIRAYLNNLLDVLPVAQKEVVILAHLHGMSQRQIASSTSLPLGTVKTRLELGMRKLSHLACGSQHKVM
ncbi:RNA polymerase sigma-70 factor, ECF subfamily [Prosthecobacter debontii]|uniref:RNA polymerase sigma-70 factor, ECF subfamily n=1 Tax=Prosthecobacter debontii TaxID=48467 RepID=A0A1T4WY46_9BACT|nr:sigma-70 family RNA polymerase sigma factor [Prosthecobacter debontii]SKA82234.1 RNA polymerase sigma-70 factor, ECF subfamily [Prosthecobacter debontii]